MCGRLHLPPVALAEDLSVRLYCRLLALHGRGCWDFQGGDLTKGVIVPDGDGIGRGAVQL